MSIEKFVQETKASKKESVGWQRVKIQQLAHMLQQKEAKPRPTSGDMARYWNEAGRMLGF